MIIVAIHWTAGVATSYIILMEEACFHLCVWDMHNICNWIDDKVSSDLGQINSIQPQTTI